MKSSIIVTSFMLFFGGIFLSSAQTDTRLGVLIAYGSEIENVGLGVNAEFPVMESLTISPSFVYYFPKENYLTVDMNWWELNANANYYFVDNENLGFYGLAGLNYSHISVDYDIPGGSSVDTSDGEFGLNLGVGANFDINSKITPFAQAKYVIIDGGQFVIAAGIRFNI